MIACMEDEMSIGKWIAEICSNDAYAAIIAAVIVGPLSIWLITHLQKKNQIIEPSKKSDIKIPPYIDPLEGLDADITGVKRIPKEDFNSSDYIKTLASRIDLSKNPGSTSEIYFEEEHDE